MLYSLVLMTYHGVVLLLSGYQANEDKILSEYKTIVDKCVLIFVTHMPFKSRH